MSDPKNTHGTPGPDEEADTASGGAPEEPRDADSGARSSGSESTDSESTDSEGTDDVLEEETTDENGMPLENPSGG